jgi:MYXO-CTERM domain-containing protein
VSLLALIALSAAQAAPCDDMQPDDIAWDGLHHDTFHVDWRDPGGALPTGGSVTLTLRACQDDLTSARLRIWDGREQQERFVDLAVADTGEDPTLGPVDLWQTTLQLPEEPTILYYIFEANDGTDTDWFVDDDPAFLGGGFGAVSDEKDDGRSFQITVYDPTFTAPAWAEGAVFYQIFPDRFRNGDPSNDPTDGSGFSYGHTDVLLDWFAPLEGRCIGQDQERAACYTGGDLAGITGELDMLADLGVDALYLNPIFRSATNHRYDTLDYRAIDDELGDIDDFTELVEEAASRDISLVLDGVFNHVSADSVYFDLYGRWDGDGQLVSPDAAGAWDGSGACESPDSPYRGWFTFPASHAPGRTEDGETVLCAADGGGLSSYDSWGSYFHIPKLAADRSSVRELIYGADDSAARMWLDAGARGWRLDVGGEIDPGKGHDAGNDFWEGFHDAVVEADPDALIIGEIWGDASAWMVGGEWHSTMNYRFRSAVLDWLFDGCEVGDGCPDGTWFEENDSNAWRESGTIDPIDEGTLALRLASILEDTPPPLWHVQMNLLGSHDVSRIGWMLRMGSRGDAALALDKQRLGALLLYTWPGMPTVYYGDEVDLSPDSRWDGGTYQDDPFNRATYPWADLGGDPDTAMWDWYANLGAVRHASPALQRGDYAVVSADAQTRVFAFVREGEGDAALVVLNRAEADQAWSATLPDAFSGATAVEDVLTGDCHAVVDGGVALGTLPGLSGVVLRDTGCDQQGGTGGGGDDGGGTGVGGTDGGGGSGGDGGGTTDDPTADGGATGGGKTAEGCSSAPQAPALVLAGLGLLGLGRRRREA